MGYLGHNSTIIRRQKVCTSCGKPCYPFSKGRCQPCSTLEDTNKRMEKETSKTIKEEDLSGLISDADSIFSKYIRLKYADADGKVACYTCGNIKHWTLQQNGHYIKRSNLFLRYDERNCRPQDAGCNEFKHGNIPEYTKRLEKETPGITDILREESSLVYKISREELRAVLSEYSVKVKALLKKINKP